MTLVSTPSVETLCETLRLLVLQSEEQLPRQLWLLHSHVLNVHLECRQH
jgi:hypothetical protein